MSLQPLLNRFYSLPQKNVMSHPHSESDGWSVEGLFLQLIYSPKGAIEGLLIDTNGISTQFVTEPHDASVAAQLTGLRVGQALVIEGIEPAPSSKGEPAHSVYVFDRLVSVNGKVPTAPPANEDAIGTVVHFNYAKHGAANGVVLDNGDFVHTRPHGLAVLKLKVGDKVKAEGPARPLATGTGRVIEAMRINGKLVAPAH
ncbi:hypothetical protein [Variovorax sp. LG9.2]|uniref:hypothetical protein n=1 Tax=Variovorax sp. LG9.2 TaxID=3048626 RepID=UPI002B2238E3|nr:hypothetical protein [Variovorax sp. LG9.2]